MITPIVKDIEKIVLKMQSKDVNSFPYYMYGHPVEVANTLTEMEKNQLKFKKYPLIVLRLDLVEKIDNDMIRVNLNLAIVTLTDAKYIASQRMDNVYIPVLYPLYEKFMWGIKTSGVFTWDGPSVKPPHTKIDRLYYGNVLQQGNDKNIFNDPLDAIEIIDLKLNKRIKC